METNLFEGFRLGFQKLMAGKTLAEIKSAKKSMLMFLIMTERQREHILDDLRLMEDYKATSKSMNEEFEKITKNF